MRFSKPAYRGFVRPCTMNNRLWQLHLLLLRRAGSNQSPHYSVFYAIKTQDFRILSQILFSSPEDNRGSRFLILRIRYNSTPSLSALPLFLRSFFLPYLFPYSSPAALRSMQICLYVSHYYVQYTYLTSEGWFT